MLAGHSQGGIAAAALACDPAAQRWFNITNVLTVGAPIANMPVPDDVHVLSIEHTQDPVPRLDARENPDRANWTTVTLDVSDKGVSRRTRSLPMTAGMIDGDPSRAADRSSFDAFTHVNGTSTEYALQRV